MRLGTLAHRGHNLRGEGWQVECSSSRNPLTPPLFLPAAQVSSLTSFDTELPFDYYSMPFCKPPEGTHRSANTANPGTVLSGTRIENSPYNFTMKVGCGADCTACVYGGVSSQWGAAKSVKRRQS